eukprot:scaffold4862_cov144-Skeletonema_dohrnii-CCMP3373.AAC.6
MDRCTHLKDNTARIRMIGHEVDASRVIRLNEDESFLSSFVLPARSWIEWNRRAPNIACPSFRQGDGIDVPRGVVRMLVLMNIYNSL